MDLDLRPGSSDVPSNLLPFHVHLWFWFSGYMDVKKGRKVKVISSYWLVAAGLAFP